MPKGIYDRKPIKERIMDAVDINEETGCWVWKLRLDKDGYGQVSVNQRTRYAHKVAYEIFKGAIPDGMVCSHLCDEKYPSDCIKYRKCCNPDHIEIVTPAENSKRMLELKRSKPSSGTFKRGDCIGSKNTNCKLTEENVIDILKRHKTGLPYGGLKKLAVEYNVSYVTIQKIVGGELWKCIDRNTL